MEPLVDALAAVVGEPLPGGPLAPEVVMVQSLGMHRWVAMHLARRHGIAMNITFPFPRAFLETTVRGFLPLEEDRFAADRMTWSIHHLLPQLLGEPAFTPVRRYLETEGDPLKYYQLATRIARLFDQYLVYRPEMLLQWERGEFPASGDAAWQARLWQRLNPEGALHLGGVLEHLRTTPPPPGSRLSIFGISSLPPAQMEFFFHLAATRPVHLFLLSPSPEYFGDDLTPKQRARRGLSPAGPDDGNPLLSSLGRLNAHFQESLLETDERAGHRMTHPGEYWQEPGGDTRLHRLQRELFLARPPEAGAEPPPPPTEKDASIAIHVCHSPMREVEVLYDQLLALFEADPALEPADILVMAPDIESYAPFIQAVFGFPEDPALRIPFSIADRHPRSENPVVDLFLRLLELPGTRATGPQLYGLFQNGVFCRRFGLDETALEQIHGWIIGSGIRWGFDGAHRESFGLPPFEEASWRHGIDRLLLGYAVSGGGERLFEGILPYDDAEAGDAEVLGRFVSIVGALDRLVRELTLPRPLTEWVPVLEGMLETFFGAGSNAAESEAIRRLRQSCGAGGRLEEIAHAAVAATAPEAGSNPPVAHEVLREALSRMLGEAEHHGRFLTGGVTFCALKPMRSIPAKVIWLLGMNDGAFPRRNPVVQFDLIARHWKPGDRSTRDDDRYLFLEALLSARRGLGISYVGRSRQNNEPIPPSVVVSELLDYLAGGGTTEADVVTVHPLQAFSRRYYSAGSPLWSYSRANAAGARTLPAAAIRPPFCPEPLPAEEPGAVLFTDFLRFFHHPAAFFLRHRLGLAAGDRTEPMEESEPLLPDARVRYRLRCDLLDAAVAGRDEPEIAVFQARSLIGPGTAGHYQYRALAEETTAFHHRIAPLLGEAQESEAFRLALPGGGILSGLLGPIRSGHLLSFRPATVKAWDRLAAWIGQVVRECAARQAGREAPPPARLFGEDRLYEYPPVGGEAAEAILATLTRIYREGWREPLPFFPASSLAYARVTLRPGPAQKRPALEVARDFWEGSAHAGRHGSAPPPENRHPACRIGFDTETVLESERFARLALEVFGPMLDHECEIREGKK